MTWMSTLIDLALSAWMLWPTASCCGEVCAPVAQVQATCPCNPCVGKETSTCNPYQCDRCPAQQACVACPPARVCQPPCCAVTHPNPPAAPCCYEVSVRLPGDGCDGKPIACPQVRLSEGSKGIVSLKHPLKGGCQLMHVQLVRIDSELVKVFLQMTGRDPAARVEAVQVVHLDTVTGVVLSGQSPEPCCAEVVVRPVKPLPVRTVMPAPAPVQFHHPLALPLPALCPVPPIAVWSGPVPPPIYPPPAYAAPLTVIRPVKYAAPAPVSCVELCKIGDKSRLSMQSKDGVSAKCVRMTLSCGQAGPVLFAAGKKYVHVSGKHWKAQADHVTVKDDGHLILSGHVRLVSDRIGAGASVKAHKLCVKVKDGSFEKIVGK